MFTLLMLYHFDLSFDRFWFKKRPIWSISFKMKFDEVLGLIGEMGPYQILIMSLVAMAMIPEAMHSLIAVFLTANMDHWCAVPEWAESVENCTSLPIRSTEYLECIHQYRDASIPVTHVTATGNPVYSQCQIYDTEYPTDFSDEFFAGDAVNSTRGCPSGWIYDQSQYKSTIVNDVRMFNWFYFSLHARLLLIIR